MNLQLTTDARRKEGVTFKYTGARRPELLGRTFNVRSLAEALGMTKNSLWNRFYTRKLNPEYGIDDEFLDAALVSRRRSVRDSTHVTPKRQPRDPESIEAAEMLKWNHLPIFG